MRTFNDGLTEPNWDSTSYRRIRVRPVGQSGPTDPDTPPTLCGMRDGSLQIWRGMPGAFAASTYRA